METLNVMEQKRRIMMTKATNGGGGSDNTSIFIIPFYTSTTNFSSQYNELFETVYQALKTSAENPYQYPVFIMGQLQQDSVDEQSFRLFTYAEVNTRISNQFKCYIPNGELFTYQMSANGLQWQIVYP